MQLMQLYRGGTTLVRLRWSIACSGRETMSRPTQTFVGGCGKVALGRQIAAALATAWRPNPLPLTLSPDALARISPRLLEKGEAGLVWRRVRRAADPPTCALDLRQEYRLQTLRAALHERHIEETVRRLRRVGAEPLLFKGWAVARLYPEMALRPFCDLDCLVPADRFAEARAALIDSPGGGPAPRADPEAHSLPIACGPDAHLVDLHHRLPDLRDRSLQELYDRSLPVAVGTTTVRVLGREDQLRLSALHFLRHSGWRPLWLCDLAVMVEQAGTDFDWDRCLGGPRRLRDWLLCALHLSHRLLGTCLDRAPAALRTCRMPSWLPRTVLANWGRTFWGAESRPMASYLRSPTGVLRAMAYRWADPIAVTLRWRLPMNRMPRLPWQVGDYLARTAGMLVGLPRRLCAGA